MIQRLRLAVRFVAAACAAGFVVICLSGCADREEGARTDGDDVSVPSVHAEREMAEAGRKLDAAQTELRKVRRKWADDSMRLGRMQNEAVKATPEIAAMEKEYLAERQAFVDRMNSWPGIRAHFEKKGERLQVMKDLTKEREEIVAELKRTGDEEKKQEIGERLKRLADRFASVREDLRGTVKEIERLKKEVRENDPEMRTMWMKLVEKQHLIYIGKVNELPEIAKLREIQEERRKRMESLKEEIAGLKTRAGQGETKGAEKRQSKELMING